MALLTSQPMGKKTEFIRIRADDALKEALAYAAQRDVRSESDEARYLLMYDAMPAEWRAAAELAGLTGLRWSEQFRMTREQVHVAEGFIELPTTKSGRPQARLLNDRAKALLAQQLQTHDLPWVYPNKSGTGPIDHGYFIRYVWMPARDAAGVTNARWNDWRHTFASDLTMAGHSDRTVAHLMGHAGTNMVKRYAHLADQHLRNAIETVAKKWPTAKPTKKPPRK